MSVVHASDVDPADYAEFQLVQAEPPDYDPNDDYDPEEDTDLDEVDPDFYHDDRVNW